MTDGAAIMCIVKSPKVPDVDTRFCASTGRLLEEETRVTREEQIGLGRFYLP
jgi:hypothetical protein